MAGMGVALDGRNLLLHDGRKLEKAPWDSNKESWELWGGAEKEKLEEEEPEGMNCS